VKNETQNQQPQQLTGLRCQSVEGQYGKEKAVKWVRLTSRLTIIDRIKTPSK
jgi:hypothetical protein